jgi:hypothetical protein
MEGYSIEMSKSGMHLVNSEDPMNDSSIANDFSDRESYDHSDSDKIERVKKITTRRRSKAKSKSKSKAKSANRQRVSKRVVKNAKTKNTFKKTSNMKDALKSIHNIESDVEHDNVKLNKKKLADREVELKRKQLPTCPASKAFRPGDIQRIVQHTTTSIFDKEKCAIWTGYITNLQNKRKGTYVNFYFRNKKKVALHRLLYANFKGDISPTEYIKYSCPNKGKCCNVNHMVKFEYNSPDSDENDEKKDKNQKNTAKNDAKGKRTRNKNNKKITPVISEKDFKISIY